MRTTGRNRRQRPPGLGSSRRKRPVIGKCPGRGKNKRSRTIRRFGRGKA